MELIAERFALTRRADEKKPPGYGAKLLVKTIDALDVLDAYEQGERTDPELLTEVKEWRNFDEEDEDEV